RPARTLHHARLRQRAVARPLVGAHAAAPGRRRPARALLTDTAAFTLQAGVQPRKAEAAQGAAGRSTRSARLLPHLSLAAMPPFTTKSTRPPGSPQPALCAAEATRST